MQTTASRNETLNTIAVWSQYLTGSIMLSIKLWRAPMAPIRPVHISASRFAEFGGDMANNAPGLGILSECIRFHSLFGVSPLVCSKLWTLLRFNRPIASRPTHLLWALLFLKVYGSEVTHRTIAQVDVKTFRKWSWCFVHLVADLQIVSPIQSFSLPNISISCARNLVYCFFR